ncbi:MAG: regulatory protein RecX, partial [Wujia sp.]
MWKWEKMTNNAFDAAANYLAFKDRTSKEIVDKLRIKGFDDEEIMSAVAKLKEYGYIDDMRYARAYINEYSGKKGRRMLMHDLSCKGIDKASTMEICDECLPDEDNVIECIISKRYPTTDFTNPKEVNRIIS